MSNPMKTSDGVGFAAKAISGVVSALGFGKKKKKRSDAFSDGTIHGDIYRASAAAQRLANKHEKEMHALQHTSLVSTAQQLGYDSTSSISAKTPSGGEISFGATNRKTTPRAKAAPKKAMTTKQAAISVPAVKPATAQSKLKAAPAKATPPAASVKSRKVK